MTFQIRKASLRNMLPGIDLFPQIPHQGKPLDVTVFGPSSYQANLAAMQNHYFHSPELSDITFREPTTSQSISTCAYTLSGYTKNQILNLGWFQLGRIVKTSEGVFINPPKDKTRNTITHEATLKAFLTDDKKYNGIYLLGTDSAMDFAFVPYDSFNQDFQDSETFARGGLARGLEYTTEAEAPKLRAISSKENYPRGVNVWGFNFNPIQNPILRVAGLISGKGVEGGRLNVDGSWNADSSGFAFGVLDTK